MIFKECFIDKNKNHPSITAKELIDYLSSVEESAPIYLSIDKEQYGAFKLEVTSCSDGEVVHIQFSKDHPDFSLEQIYAQNTYLKKLASAKESNDSNELDVLSRDKNYAIRYAVAQNEFTSKITLRKLSIDDNEYVKNAVLQNSNCPKDLLKIDNRLKPIDTFLWQGLVMVCAQHAQSLAALTDRERDRSATALISAKLANRPSRRISQA